MFRKILLVKLRLLRDKYLRHHRSELLKLNYLLDNLFISSLLTLLIYFLALALFYAQINSNSLYDPCQRLDLNTSCLLYDQRSTPPNPDFLNDLSVLTTLVTGVLEKNKNKYFLCYRTLLELLRLRNGNSLNRHTLDICVYEPNQSAVSVLKNILGLFGFSQIQHDFRSSHLVTVEFNSLFGYYKISYHSATVYLYLFVYATPNRVSFAGLRRHGFIYTQFEALIEHFKSTNRLDGRRSYATTEGPLQQISIFNRLPFYMIQTQRVEYRVRIAQHYFSLPCDPYNALMHFYPNLWWSELTGCTV